MGLDQWLRAKTTKREYKEPTGVCSGLFPVTLEDNGMVEIGYWRKAYDQGQLIESIARGEWDEHDQLKLTYTEMDKIQKEAERILAKHEFDEEGFDLTSDDPLFDSEWDTWQSKRKWEDTVKFFAEAKAILDDDPNAEIYYTIWY